MTTAATTIVATVAIIANEIETDEIATATATHETEMATTGDTAIATGDTTATARERPQRASPK